MVIAPYDINGHISRYICIILAPLNKFLTGGGFGYLRRSCLIARNYKIVGKSDLFCFVKIKVNLIEVSLYLDINGHIVAGCVVYIVLVNEAVPAFSVCVGELSCNACQLVGNESASVIGGGCYLALFTLALCVKRRGNKEVRIFENLVNINSV